MSGVVGGSLRVCVCVRVCERSGGWEFERECVCVCECVSGVVGGSLRGSVCVCVSV